MLSRHFKFVSRVAPLAWMILAALPLLGAAALSATLPSATVLSCPFSGVAATDLYRGFYVTHYPGQNLGRVTLGYGTNTPGRFSITLTARRNTFDGPMIGSTQTATIDLGTGETLVTFDFGGAPVSTGDTITFIQTGSQLSSPVGQFGSLFFDSGSTSCANLVETENTVPPLDTVRLQGLGLSIDQESQQALGPACAASDTVLCLDGTPGDRRFAVKASFHTSQSGGLSGNAQAIPLAQLGASRGGVLWFFNPDNPELLVKIVNGCALNGYYWVFLSATTNVGYTVTVDDSILTNSKSYSNTDLTAASPVQDTAALASCGSCTSDAQCRNGSLCCFIPGGNMACLTPTAGGTCPLYP